MWPGETVAILAGGPSLAPGQVAAVREAHAAGRCRVIAVNNIYARAPWADMLYACDGGWWRRYRPDFSGLKVTQDGGAAAEFGLLRMPCESWAEGLSFEPLRTHGGGNGGFQAWNLAILAGASRTILLGFDLKRAADGRRHSYPDHAAGLNNPDESNFANWRAAFALAGPQAQAAGVDTIVCNPDSGLAGLAGFRLADLQAALETNL